ncbi:hypothetical protein AURDEDRAFT_109496 [Auricularia subglabra TFB-10046 SS5]|nr:hypothetical protein AURDEDRAFT_109496 [Auricularia subglabra TFB-10046 SS5]
MDLSKVEFPARLRSVVLPAVTANLHRADVLCLDIDVAFDFDCFSALRYPAPRLKTFDMVMASETRWSDALPVDLFASQAPNLRFVRLINVQLYAERLPPAFSPITTLRYLFAQPQSFPTAVFAHCKQLRTLRMYGESCSFVHDSNSESSVEPRALESVDLSMFTGNFNIMRHLPCAGIPDISSTLADEQSAELLLAHLRGRLDVHVYPAFERLYVQYKCRDTGMKRAFACRMEQAEIAYVPPIYRADCVVSRVDTIHCSSTCTGLLSAFRKLPSCTRVVLSLADGSPTTPPLPLYLPALEHVQVSSETPTRLSTSDLATFLDRTLAPGSRAVQVALTGVSLDGNLAVLGKRFVITPTS